MHRPSFVFAAVLSATLLLPAACSEDSPQRTDQTPKPDGGGGDGGLAQDADAGADVAPDGAGSLPELDPTQGSFSDARSKVDALLAIARQAEVGAPDRFFPLRDPLLIASAVSEVFREQWSNTCAPSQYGCPSATSAKQLLTEYQANKAFLGAGLKKAQAASHAWGRIALAAQLLWFGNLLEDAKALSADDLSVLLPAASTLAAAMTPTTTPVGVYPELGANAPLYRFVFEQIPPAPSPTPAHLAAANTFIDAFLARLAPSATDAKTAVEQLLSIIVQGIIVQGSEAAQVTESLSYLVKVGKAPEPAKIDGYLGAIDDVLTKVASSSATAQDWAKYAATADEFAGSLDASAGALAATVLTSLASTPAAEEPGGLETDPNVYEKLATSAMQRESWASLLWIGPSVNIRFAGYARPAIAERRAPILLPAGVELDLPARAGAGISEPAKLYVKDETGDLTLAWYGSESSAAFDHFEVRIENVTTKKRVFHKIYRRAADQKIATRTRVRVDPSWFTAGPNQLELQATAVDRQGLSSGIACATLSADGSASSYTWGSPGAGKCFARAVDLGDAPVSLGAPGADVVIGSYLGTPFRPTYFNSSTKVRIYNDSPKARRLRSLFSPDYSEIPSVDLSIGGIAPLDTGNIAPGTFVDLALPATAPKGFSFLLFDSDNGPKYRLRLQLGSSPYSKPW